MNAHWFDHFFYVFPDEHLPGEALSFNMQFGLFGR